MTVSRRAEHGPSYAEFARLVLENSRYMQDRSDEKIEKILKSLVSRFDRLDAAVSEIGSKLDRWEKELSSKSAGVEEELSTKNAGVEMEVAFFSAIEIVAIVVFIFVYKIPPEVWDRLLR